MSTLSKIVVRLRWKLALAYTVVTVSTAIVMALIGAYFFERDAAEYSSTGNMIYWALNRDAHEIIDALETPRPARSEALTHWLDEKLEKWGKSVRSSQIPFSRRNVAFLAIVDRATTVIASYPEGRLILGRPITEQLPPAGYRLLDNMMQRVNPIMQNGAYAGETRQRIVVVNVVDPDDQVLGAIVLAYKAAPRLFTARTLGAIRDLIVRFGPYAAVVGAVFGFVTAAWMTRRLKRLEEGAVAWSRGDFSIGVPDKSRDEIGRLGLEMNRMAGQLEQLLQTRQDLATLEERNRVARELHDSVKQQLFAGAMQLAAARECVQTTPDDVAIPLAEAERLIQSAGRELTRLIRELRPAELEGKGLGRALGKYVRAWSDRTGIAAELRTQGGRETAIDSEQALYRVAQEALSNVERHSGARRVDVHLRWESDTVVLSVADDGDGFESSAEHDGHGLRNMKERVADLGGTLFVESVPGEGTTLSATVPAYHEE